MKEFSHKSVLLEECIRELKIDPEGTYVDGTLGGAGHSSEIAKRLTTGKLIGFDQDAEAIEASSRRLEPFGDRVTIIRDNFSHISSRVQELGITSVNGELLDLGVSSYQIDTPERGFSYMTPEADLDMRMDQSSSMTAADIINNYSREELFRILRDYGEEKFASAIASRIVKEREKAPIKKVGELNSIIDASIPAKIRKTGGHPAKRTFQALRIELNDELGVLEGHIDEWIDLLAPGGRLCIITFHSLEDRIVKAAFKRNEDPCTCPREFPVCVCGKKSKGKVITKKPILPTDQEMEENSRSKSAKLRVFEKISPSSDI
jgi:16S rRNA (cytosine1402-N4)-methyltransferase